jgi:hypothetical protein
MPARRNTASSATTASVSNNHHISTIPRTYKLPDDCEMKEELKSGADGSVLSDR